MTNLSKKMVEVMKECRHIATNGSNDFHKYKYATAADVLEMVNDSLTKHGIFTTVETNLLEMREVTTAKGNTEILASVETVVTLIDSDSGETATRSQIFPTMKRACILYTPLADRRKCFA